jgi:hypothetical protein
MNRIEGTKHFQQLDKEIEEMERAISGKPSSSPEEVKVDTADENHEEHEVIKVTPEETVLVSGNEVTPPPEPKRTSWKQEYQVLEDRYRKLRSSTDAKLYQLRTENGDLLKTVRKLEEQVDTLSTKLATYVNSQEDDFSDLFTTDEIDIMGGPDYLQSLSKVANKLVEKKVKPLEQKLEEEKKEKRKQMELAEERARREAHLSFLSRLEEAAPNYKSINTNPDFLKWLDGFDSDSGYSRLEQLRTAQNLGDVPRVASFFIRWEKVNSEETNPILEKKIGPKGSQSGPIKTQQKGVEIIPYSVIAKFYDEDAKGRYRNNPKKADELEKKFDIARMEGRIDFNR